MLKTLISIFLTGFLLFCFSQDKSYNDTDIVAAWLAGEKIYQQAEELASKAENDDRFWDKTDQTYRLALSAFTTLIPEIRKTGNDSLLFFTYLRTGYIHYYFDSLEPALNDYLRAIELRKELQGIPDSFLFKPLLFTGGIYYARNDFDSAINYYRKAEQVNDLYEKSLDESQRLFNRLGVMYYETGEYRQAKNYFERAISAHLLAGSSNNSMLVNYKINIASLHVKLEEFEEARALYKKLLPNEIFHNEINHNLGIISLRLKNYKEAIDYFNQVNYKRDKKNIELYYNLAMAYTGLGLPDSSASYLNKAMTENSFWNGTRKNNSLGLVLKFQGDELAKRNSYNQAIDKYQQAIAQFYPDFNAGDNHKNPEEYSGAFSYINLFNVLIAKGETLERLYAKEKEITILESSLNAFRSAYHLTDYVEKTFDSDDARLFLNKIKHTVHSKPIDVSLLLFDLTNKENYLEEAYFFDQQNKASVLALNIRENAIRKTMGQENKLLEEESALKSAITRLTLKAIQTADSAELQQAHISIRELEIKLGKLREKINNDPAWQQKNPTGQIPFIRELQDRLDKHSAVISYHLSASDIITLIITHNKADYHRTIAGNDFLGNIDSLKNILHRTNAELRYPGTGLSMKLYDKLIAPLRSRLPKIDRLIIIPDDELNYLPFEALQDGNKQFLVENFSIQYQFSTALLKEEEAVSFNENTLAFAPFSSESYVDSSGYKLNVLPASLDEVQGLKGKIFIDTAATKNNFLDAANSYSILHLATHASVNNEEPFRSFIAFYPGGGEYKLYAQEIYDLDLDSTRLVILSACETGAGRLVKGEGLMSISRAFAYAGCSNIITSLWKAEDKATAFITQRLHHYLEKNYKNDKALQLAKLDLLKTDLIDPRYKSPNYWAHLVFIGKYSPAGSNSYKWWMAAAGLLIVVAVLLFIGKKKL